MQRLCGFLGEMVTLYKNSSLTSPFLPDSMSRLRGLDEVVRQIAVLRKESETIKTPAETKALLQRFSEKALPLAMQVHEVFGETLVASVTKEIEQLRDAEQKKEGGCAPQAEGSTSSKGVDEVPGLKRCSGIKNERNMCFTLSVLKGLWASSRIRNFIASLEKDQKEVPPIVSLLSDLFRLLDTQNPEILVQATDPVLKKFFEEIRKRHAVLQDAGQQDATEFLQAVFQEILPKNEYLFSFQEISRRPAEMKAECYIPSIDSTKNISENVLVVPVPKDLKEVLDLQKEISSPVREETVQKEEILQSEANSGAGRSDLASQISSVEGKTFLVRRERVFQGKAPPILAVHVWRQIEKMPFDLAKARESLSSFLPRAEILRLKEDEIKELSGANQIVRKCMTPVHAPKNLSIRHKDAGELFYTLRSIIVHVGNAEGGGHYYTYVFPSDEGSSEKGRFVCKHNDDKVSMIPLDAALQKEIDENGYAYMYDLVDQKR